MIKLKNIGFERGRPAVVVPVSGETLKEIAQGFRAASEAPGCDMIEWRADFWLEARRGFAEDMSGFDPMEMGEVMEAISANSGGKPVIFTPRSVEQGGRFAAGAGKRLELCEFAASSGIFRIIDVELPGNRKRENIRLIEDAISRIRAEAIAVMVSYHDFRKMPGEKELRRIAAGMKRLDCDIIKIAVMPDSAEDSRRLMDISSSLCEEGYGPLVMIAMGEKGAETRIKGGRYGSCMTFAAMGKASAPGQIEVGKMKELLDGCYPENRI